MHYTRPAHNHIIADPSQTYIIDELKKYMLDGVKTNVFSQPHIPNDNDRAILTSKPKSTQPKSPQPKFNNKTTNATTTNATTTNSNLFLPNVTTDTLFWCFYVMKHDVHAYEMLSHKNIVGEKKIKIEYVELMRQNKTILKTYKFSTLTNMENVLANEHKLDIPTFFSLCVLENLNVVFIKNKTYFELLMNDTEDVFVLHYLNNNKYGVELSSLNAITKMKEPLIKLDNVQKPLKSISAYKVEDLTSMCNKLGLPIINDETTKSKNKKDLYDTLFKYF